MSWLFGSNEAEKREKRLRGARRLMRDLDYVNARRDLLGWEDAEAKALITECEHRLVDLNLDAWAAFRSSGERMEAAEALRRAKEFGATPEQLSAAGVRSHENREGAPDLGAPILPRPPQGNSRYTRRRA